MNVEEIQYRGYTIKIHQDQDAENPYDNDEGMYPMLVDGGYRGAKHDYLDAGQAFFPTTNQYRRHKKALIAALELEDVVNDTWVDIWGNRVSNNAQETEDAVIEAIQEAVSEHKYDTLEAVGKILGVPCLHTSSSGYCQGDHVEMLVVWTPQFEKVTGLKKKYATEKSMKDNAKVYGAWCWGNVYGYVVEDKDGEHVDSCWGYIETEPWPIEDTYVVQEAKHVVDAHIERMTKQHAAKLKEQIRAKVPYQYREPLQIGA